MNESTNVRQRIGFAILIAIQVIGFACIFFAMWQYDELNSIVTYPWLCAFSFAIAFSVMVSHFYAMWLSKKIGWISLWFWITNAMIAGLWVYSRLRAHDYQIYENEFVTMFVYATLGGVLGGFIGFGLVRRFAPGWLGFKKSEQKIPKRQLNLRTIFFWLTSIGIICGAMVNRKSLYLVIWDHLGFLLVIWFPGGAILAALFCLFIFTPVTAWLRHAKPFWLAVLTLVVFSLLLPVVLFGIMSVVWISYEGDAAWLAIVYSVCLGCLSLIAVIWVSTCKLAGLIHEQPVTASSKSVWRKPLLGMGWFLKLTGFAIAISSLAYAAGWCFVHFTGGPERNPAVVRAAITKSLRGTDVDEDWIEIINREWSKGVTKENNLAVKLLQVSNPFERQPHPAVTKYVRKMGLTKEEFESMPVIDVWAWIDKENEKYRESLRSKFPSLDGNAVESISQDENVESDDQSTENEPAARDEQSRERILAKFFYDSPRMRVLANVPWNKNDYPVGADFIETHRPQLAKLRQLSKEEKFYSPLVRDFEWLPIQLGDEILNSVSDLLAISAMYHTGSGDVDQAIEDCKTLFRFTRPHITRLTTDDSFRFLREINVIQTRALYIAEAVAMSERADLEQMKNLLKLHLEQPIHLSEIDPGYRIYSALLRDKIYRSGRRQSIHNPFPNWPHVENPFPSGNLAYPLIDWEQFNLSLDHSMREFVDTLDLAGDGTRNFAKVYERNISLNYVSVGPSSQLMDKAGFYSVFGRQLVTFIKGPKTKARVLCEVEVAEELQNVIPGLYMLQTSLTMKEIAIALEIFKRSNGEYPETLQQLVPEILPKLKSDPFSGTEFVYQRNKESFLLYSLFFNQVDDGGNPESGDLVYERPVSDLLELPHIK